MCPNEHSLSQKAAVQDDFRVDYLTSYADQIAAKIKEGVPVKSYLMWAWTDNFECRSTSGSGSDKQGKRVIQRGSESSGSITRTSVRDTRKSRPASCEITLHREW